MWRLKQIACFTPPGPQQAVLSRDDLAQQAQAQSLLDAAQYQAQALIEQAQEEARQIRQQAEADAISICEDAQARFWQQAQPLFDDWQQQREAQQRQVVELASRLLAEGLSHCLAQVPPQDRLQALLTQLLNRCAPEIQATLCCAPSQQPTLAAWLSERPALRWRLAPDEGLPPESLRLVTDQGEMAIDWRTFCQALGAEG